MKISSGLVDVQVQVMQNNRANDWTDVYKNGDEMYSCFFCEQLVI